MHYIVAVEERRPDCWMLLPPRSGGRRRTGGLAPGGAAEERAGRRRPRAGEWDGRMEGREGTKGEAGEPAAAAGPRIARRRQSLQLAGWGKVGIEEGKHVGYSRAWPDITSVAAWLCLGSWANGLVTHYLIIHVVFVLHKTPKLFRSQGLVRKGPAIPTSEPKKRNATKKIAALFPTAPATHHMLNYNAQR